ncbi:MAG: hypothetical protein MHPSP_003617, partial [Paramarteilia canceri]
SQAESYNNLNVSFKIIPDNLIEVEKMFIEEKVNPLMKIIVKIFPQFKYMETNIEKNFHKFIEVISDAAEDKKFDMNQLTR